jgi:predicted HTH transcriptional regulator
MLRENIVQEVAAFLNSKEGGAVVIGVDDQGKVVGLADDYPAADARKPNRDGYELFLRNVLASNLEADCGVWYAITFHRIGAHEVCRVRVQPATRPLYVKDELHVRHGNQKRKLSTREALAYRKQRWG